jgi:hypothetical protein
MTVYIWHDPKTNKILGKFNTSGFRNAALKIATKGIDQIILRQSGTLIVHEFEGFTQILDPPVEIEKDGRTIKFSKKSNVKYIKKLNFSEKNKMCVLDNE